MQVRELVTKLGFNADTQQARRYDNTLASVRRTAMVASAAVASLSAAATTLVSSFVQSSSETLSWSRRIGIATDELQRLQFVASRYNVTNEALVDGLKEASLRADEFIKTGKGGGAEAFERLGLSAGELNRVSEDTGELFALIQRRIQDVDNAAARQRIADEIFGGQAGEQFTEFLAAGRDETERMGRLAERMGAIVPEKSLERARELGQEFNTLKAAFRGIGATVASELLPVFRDIVDTTIEWLAANRKWIASGFTRSLSWLRVVLSSVWSVIRGFVDAVDIAVENTIGWETALKTIRAVLLTLIGYKLAAWLLGIARAIRSTVTAVGLLRAGLIALQRVGILLLLTAIAGVLDEIYNWIKGNNSLLGKWIGSWKNFKEKFFEYIRPVTDFLEDFNEILYGALTLDPARVLKGLTLVGEHMIRWAKSLSAKLRDALLSMLPDWLIGGIETGAGWAKKAFDFVGQPGGGDLTEQARRTSNRRIDINARTEAVLQVPQGTSEEQRRSLETQVDQMFRYHWNRELRRAQWDFQPVE